MKRRIVSLLLTIVMLMGIVPIQAFATETESVEPVLVETAPEETAVVPMQIDAEGEQTEDIVPLSTPSPAAELAGAGSVDSPFLICSADDFEIIRKEVNENGNTYAGMYFKMEADITLSAGWNPIGIKACAFGGTIDGNGKTLTIPEGGLPLLGHVNGAVVKNMNIYGKRIAGYGLVNNLEGLGLSGNAITIDNVTLKSGSSTLKAGFVGTYLTDNAYAGCSAGFTVTIKNCTIEENVVIGYNKDQSMIGSFAGRMNGTIENCRSYATVYGVDYVGGLLGTRDNSKGNCSINSSTFGGTVEATGQHVGGIAGGGYNNSTAPNAHRISINNCTVTGSVKGTDKVGGILGGDSFVAQAWNAYTFKNNTFKGKVAASSGSYIGGIIGYYRSLNKFDDIAGNFFASDCGAETGIGGVTYIDTNCTNRETTSGTAYFNTAEGVSGLPEIEGCDWRINHNRTDDPLGADAEKLAYSDREAKLVEALINAIGVVSLDSEDAITAARTAYEALNDTQKALVKNYNTLIDAETTYADLIEAAANKAAAAAVEAKINAIGIVSVDSGSVIKTAREAYETLTDPQKLLVNNYHVLTNAESAYAALLKTEDDELAANAVETLIAEIGTVTKDSGEKITEARDAYDKLTDVQKILVNNYLTLVDAEVAYAALVQAGKDETAASEVEVLIETIGAISKDSGEAIKNARDAYDKLTDAQKALVDNYKTLTDAEAAYATLVQTEEDETAAGNVEKLIAAIGTVTKDSSEAIKAARSAYDKLTDTQKALVENYEVLTAAEAKLKELNSTAKVSITVLGCYKHDSSVVHTFAAGNLNTWIGKKTYNVEPGTTVKTVLEKALTEAGMSYSNASGNYVESINGMGSLTNGSNSGWMFTLNGVYPNMGVAEQMVKNGDVIVFHYTDDYTKEKGGSGEDDDEKAADKVENLINAIGMVTLESKEKIEAARKAYDALTYAQKQKVENYKKLTDAEAKFTELKETEDEQKADAVEDLIDKLDSHSATFEEDVQTAKTAYDKLTDDQKKLVDNYQKLVAALKELAKEEDKKAAEKVEKLIADIGTVTKDSEAKIKAAREAYDKLFEEQKVLVKNYEYLEKAEAQLDKLKKAAASLDALETTGDYLQKMGTPVPGSIGGEWMVIGLLRSGREVPGADDYYANVVKYVQENIDENGRLHRSKSSDNSRMILALTAMGKDVTDVGGYNLLSGLSDMEYILQQGINGPVWALLAFESGNYPAPAGNVTREALLQTILDEQLDDGGWTLMGDDSDPDITGMVLQALARYYETNADVKKAVDEAVEALSMMQAADGSFASVDGGSSESIAQVVTALSALGIDAHNDVRFIKNGISALDALCAFYVEDGGFKHISDGKLDRMATEQGYYALTAYFRMLEGKTALFDMTDVINMGGGVLPEEAPIKIEPVPTEPAFTEPTETPVETDRSFPWWLMILIVVLSGTAVVLVIVSKPKKRRR